MPSKNGQHPLNGIEVVIPPGTNFNQSEAEKPRPGTSLFKIQTASEWSEEAKLRPVPKMLFGEFWFEGEVCILFADTNLGKSILAVQIGNSISTGVPILGFDLEAEMQPILYFDFELTDKQFENRYSDHYQDHYFKPGNNDNFLRAEIDPEIELPDSVDFEKFVSDSIERAVVDHNCRVIIIDNITYLKHDNEKAKDALPLMKQLKALKKKYGLSILALAHTPKRDLSKPITRNDLQGSKMLINFCDSAFAIGESCNDPSGRYIKQIKARNTEVVYGEDNVCLCQISKPGNFLQFEFLDYCHERSCLKQVNLNEREQQKIEAMELHSSGMSNVEIAKQFGVTEGAVRKWVKKYNETMIPNP